MNGNLGIQLGLSGRFDFSLRNRGDGRLFDLGGPKPNLITDAGLDMPASNSWEHCFTYFMWGDGDSPALYTDTALEHQLGSTQTYSRTENGATYNFAERYVEIYSTFYSTNTSGVAIPVREFSVSPDGTNSFNRVVLDADLSWPNNYDLLAKYTLRLNLPQWRNPTATTLTIGSQSVPGKIMIAENGTGNSPDNILSGFHYISSERSASQAGTFTGHQKLEPAVTSAGTSSYQDFIRCITGETSLSGMSATSSVTGPVGSSPNYLFARDAYVAGNHYVDRKITIPPADWYGATLYGFAMNAGWVYYGGHFTGPSIFFRADAGFTHPQTAQWVISQRLSWARA